MSLQKPTAEEFKRADRLWQQMEGDLNKLAAERRSLSASIQKLTFVSDQQNAYALMDNINKAEKELIDSQQELEAWLIENEAPGWTST